MPRAKTRSRRQNSTLNKAITPALTQAMNSGPNGLVPRRIGLMDAINIATNRGQPTGFWGMDALPRDPLDEVAFGPNHPLLPQPIDPPDPHTGMPDPRVWEYPHSWNLPGNNKREVPWQVLRASAMGVDIIRRCIEARKKHVRTLQWSWSVSASVIEAAYASEKTRGYDEVAAELREKHASEINRLTEFWRQPWKTAPAGPWNFGKWINSVMEEYLTLDAVAVYPRRTLGGDLFALEQVDGSTIKPLLDHRGAMPLPPHPAYQQELYGFPRGEWAASVTVNDGVHVIENGYRVGELYYHRENTRVHSPYGLSAVEQALFSSRLYLKRQQWLLAEYDDGSTPLTMMEPPVDPSGATFGPQQRRDWEDAFNAEYAGQTAARHRLKVAPPGWKARQLQSADERYKPHFDLHVIKLVVGFFGMNASELGFSEQQGLGSAGWAETQADAQGRVGLKPDTQVLADVVNDVSRDFANAPPELEFSFMDPASANDAESDSVAKSQRERATITLNQERRALKLPLYPFKEADMPFLISPTGPIFLEGSFERAQAQAEATQMQAQAQVDGTQGKLDIEQAKLEDGKEAREEGREFTREQMAQQADTEKAAAADQPHTGAMVALVPTVGDAARLAVDGGEAADQLHLTLRYLGKGADFDEQSRQNLIGLVRGYVEMLPVVHADAFNVAVFNPGGDEPCITLGVGGDQVADVHSKVAAAIEDYGGDLPEPRQPFVAHVTLAYTGDLSLVEQLADRTGPIVFDRLRVAFAGQSVDIPLADSATVAKAAAVELAAFRTWRRRNPTPRRPFEFKIASPDMPELADVGPDVAAFADWVWVGDLEKYEAWWPRDGRGRWVKRSHLGAHLTNEGIRSLADDQLFGAFHRLSQSETLDEDLVQRLVDDMDRRERETPFAGLADEDMTDDQRRVDELVAQGRDFLSAYAQVHGHDEGSLTEQAAMSTLDRKAGETKHQAMRRGYDEWLDVAYLQAEKGTRGNMLNRAGKAAGIDPLDLFTGPISRARRYASEELQRYWRARERMNFTQWRAQLAGRERDVRAAETTRLQSNARDFI